MEINLMSACLLPVILWVVVFGLYLLLSKGLSRSARWQQASRFAVASVLASLPVIVAAPVSLVVSLYLIIAVSVGWTIVWPGINYIANRSTSSELDNKMDLAFGLYLAGWLSSLYLAAQILLPGNFAIAILMSVIEIPIAVVLVAQIMYYLMYKVCVDHDALRLVQYTYGSEVVEFLKSFPLWSVGAVTIAIILSVVFWVVANLTSAAAVIDAPWWLALIELAIFGTLTAIMFTGRHSAFSRTGIVTLWNDNREYDRQTEMFATGRAAKLAALEARQKKGRPGSPHTFVIVIGESASRDYMSAFTPQPEGADTTPWMSGRADTDPGFILFPNAYSSYFQTVPTLSRALTEMSQYNTLGFHESLSFVDIARKLGYKIHWFSNQSHIGINDTAVSLMAETADDARWTRLELDKIPYDEVLLDFLDDVDPSKDNIVVLHLKGSHFNYRSRYPDTFDIIKPAAGENPYIAQYRNSLRYTDDVLRRVYEYADTRLNLAAMIYCSDHAEIPVRHRAPRFDGFAQLRIPLAVALTDRYTSAWPDVADTLRNNSRRPFTNDLLYELILGALGVESNHYDPRESIASPTYRHTRDTLVTRLGALPLAQDPSLRD